MDPLVTSIASRAVGPVKAAVLYFWRQWFPRRLGYQMAPKNILELIGPYVHRRKVIELLGHPHEYESGRAAYRFANALLQINYDGASVANVVLVSLRMAWPNRFEIFPFDFRLGASTFSDVCELQPNGNLEMKVDSSTKFYTLWKEEYFGHSGRYHSYYFALLSAAVFPGVEMPPADYDRCDTEPWDQAILRNPGRAKFNAVMISKDNDELFAFDFTMFN
ncbi:hypothetical protein [Cupriavidus sp. IK-TO18]|uniref:hypothetical protein n=1 Tax=Cupriavidus sp. IK-TO18 TaxID=2782182 RepID=UPI001897CAE4|nr:hypothetical protein [Cupriavidus sp. IK-TO18]MBF6990778.1 hypothetical protein [Cupriavidus sp. IK-TO18]